MKTKIHNKTILETNYQKSRFNLTNRQTKIERNLIQELWNNEESISQIMVKDNVTNK